MAIIHAAAFPPAERWPEPAIAELLALPGVYGLIEPCSGFVLARSVADEAEILTLAVTPMAQRQGAGGCLLRTAMAAAKLHNGLAVFLEVSAHNHAALALYASAGFVECGRRPHYYTDGADALVLRASLISA